MRDGDGDSTSEGVEEYRYGVTGGHILRGQDDLHGNEGDWYVSGSGELSGMCGTYFEPRNRRRSLKGVLEGWSVFARSAR